jgi:hypothetical protein
MPAVDRAHCAERRAHLKRGDRQQRAPCIAVSTTGLTSAFYCAPAGGRLPVSRATTRRGANPDHRVRTYALPLGGATKLLLSPAQAPKQTSRTTAATHHRRRSDLRIRGLDRRSCTWRTNRPTQAPRPVAASRCDRAIEFVVERSSRRWLTRTRGSASRLAGYRLTWSRSPVAPNRGAGHLVCRRCAAPIAQLRESWARCRIGDKPEARSSRLGRAAQAPPADPTATHLVFH